MSLVVGERLSRLQLEVDPNAPLVSSEEEEEDDEEEEDEEEEEEEPIPLLPTPRLGLGKRHRILFRHTSQVPGPPAETGVWGTEVRYTSKRTQHY